jgi:multidrug efflux pump subunit AcrA (membrane-fusion protein)
MYAEARVDRRAVEGPTVPSAAVLSRLGPDGALADGVLVADGELARWVPVRRLAQDGDRVAVEGALAAGDRVLVSGHVDLADGSAIQVAGAAAR